MISLLYILRDFSSLQTGGGIIKKIRKLSVDFPKIFLTLS